MSRKPAWSFGDRVNPELAKMKPGRFYVLELSFGPSNPVHRYVAHCRVIPYVDLLNEDQVSLRAMAFVRVVGEIEAMNVEEYPNRFKLPDEISCQHCGGSGDDPAMSSSYTPNPCPECR